MTLGKNHSLFVLPLLALLCAPLTACEETGGGTEDSGVVGDDDDDDDDDTVLVGDDDDDDDDDGGGLADLAAGTFNGIAAGPVNDVNYDLLVVAETIDSVTVSGRNISAFTIPLIEDGGKVQQGQWGEGSFSLDGDTLEVVHNPQGFSFTGTRK